MKSNVTEPVIGRDYRVEVRPYPGGSTYEGTAKFKYIDAQGTWVFDWTGSDVFYDPLRPDKFSCVAVAELSEPIAAPKTLPTTPQPDHLIVFGVRIPRRIGGGDFGWYEGRIAGCKINVWRDLTHWSATVRGWGAEREMKLEVVDIAPRLIEHAIMLIRRELLQLIELTDPEPHEFVLDRRDPRGEVWKLPTPREAIEEGPETDPCPTPP